MSAANGIAKDAMDAERANAVVRPLVERNENSKLVKTCVALKR